MELKSFHASHVGNVRKSNEDSVAVYPDSGLFLVADGMGGHDDGEIASRLAIEVVYESLLALDGDAARVPPASGFWRSLLERSRRRRRRGEWIDPLWSLRRAVEAANERIYLANQEREEGLRDRPMGTTVVALRCDLAERSAMWAHVGDSRLYLARGSGLKLLTADHTAHGERYAALDDEAESEIPTTLPHTNRLTRALGIDAEVEVAAGRIDLRTGDRFLLCSDGVSGMVPAEILAQMLIDPDPLAMIGSRLIEAALAAGGKDNASLVLVELVGA